MTRRVLRAVCVMLVIAAGLQLDGPEAAEAAGIYNYDQKGVDSCAAPSTTQMQTWWNYSPYYHWYIYIGCVSRACAQSNLTAAWVTAVIGQGWGLMPVWVGPQAPCTGFTYRISYNLQTAWNQGVAEGEAAYNKAMSLGMGSKHPIAYDLEAFDTSNSTCLSATRSFMRGWVQGLHGKNAGEKAGLYGSSCGSALDGFAALTPPPDFVWGADWDGILTVTNMACVSASHWTGYTRHKQYRGPQNETYGGVLVNVDRDCAYGPMYSNTSVTGGPC